MDPRIFIPDVEWAWPARRSTRIFNWRFHA
jgi:hypothetical protein